MEKARLRALTHAFLQLITLMLNRRNGKSPTKGIDTNLYDITDCRVSPVEMEKARLRALTRN